MKSYIVAFISAWTTICALGLHANESVIKESKPIGIAPSITKEDVQKGVENGALCTDVKGSANSRGAVITQNGKLYRCVKSYGQNFTENQKLVWVELTTRNGELVTAD